MATNGGPLSFRGCLGRPGYVVRVGLLVAAMAAVWLAGPVDESDSVFAAVPGVMWRAGVLAMAAALLWCWSVQRLHDVGMRGWWLCCLFVGPLLFSVTACEVVLAIAAAFLALVPGLRVANPFALAEAAPVVHATPEAIPPGTPAAPAGMAQSATPSAAKVMKLAGIGIGAALLAGLVALGAMIWLFWYTMTHIRV